MDTKPHVGEVEDADHMKAWVREHLEEKERENMSQPAGITMSTEQFQELLKAISSPKLNPIEEKKLKEELEKEARREKMALQLAEIEEQQRINKQNGCSHMRDAQGNSVARGSQGAVWTTSGQTHGDDTITIICQRCSTTWRFKATASERDYAMNAEHGLLGFPPPAPERVIQPN